MRLLYLLMFFLCIVKSYSQNNDKVIKVDYNLTKEELISKFVKSNCNQISNVKVYPEELGNDKSQVAYFSKQNSDFKFENGIVISSGYAKNTVGPANTYNDKGGLIAEFGKAKGDDKTGSGTDLDLQEILSIGEPELVNDVAYLQFDFIPLINRITFNYLFASEEYRQANFSCEYSDIFAFILIDEHGNKENLAVLPGTDIPVQVTNVHPFTYEYKGKEKCTPKNEAYFDRLQEDGTGAILHKGFTIPLKSEATVIPGKKYTIKLVLADYKDKRLDCAVFLEGNSFSIGPKSEETVYLCGGEQTTLTPFQSYLDENDNYDANSLLEDIKWYKNGQLIANATNPKYIASEVGKYVVEAKVKGTTCILETKMDVKFAKSPVIGNHSIDIIGCTSSDKSTFNLTLNDAKIRGTEFTDDHIYEVSYYETLNDAQQKNNKIKNPSKYSIDSSVQDKEIFVRLGIQTKSNSQSCYAIKSFKLKPSKLINLKEISPLNSFEKTEVNLKEKEVEIFSGYTASDYKISYYENQNNAFNNLKPIKNLEHYSNLYRNNCKPIYFRVEHKGLTSCFVVSSFEVCHNNISVGSVNEMVVCGENGFATFNLEKNNEAITNDKNISISYHETKNDAKTNKNPLDDKVYSNTVPNEQIIYFRAQDNTTNRFIYKPLTLKVNSRPKVDLSMYDQMMINLKSEESKRTIDSGFEDNGNYEFKWSLNGKLLSDNLSSLVVNKGGEYSLTVINKATGCESNSYSVKIKAPIIVYDGLSPNGDDYNEYLRMDNIEAFKNNNVKIYNRWGSLVFEVNGYTNDSDKSFRGISNKGKVIGDKLVVGVYYYLIDLGDGSKELQGFFHINR